MKFHVLPLALMLPVASAAAPALAAEVAATPATCYGMPWDSEGQPIVGVAEVPTESIEKYMPVGTSAQGLPETIQGIWWMDGNPGGLLVTLGQASYDAATRTAVIPLQKYGTYATAPSPSAGCKHKDPSDNNEGLVVKFSEDFKHAVLIPGGVPKDKNDDKDNNDMRWTMDLESDGHWVRHTYMFGITLPDYQLRRLVNADGSHNEFLFQEFVDFAGPTVLLGFGPGGGGSGM